MLKFEKGPSIIEREREGLSRETKKVHKVRQQGAQSGSKFR